MDVPASLVVLSPHLDDAVFSCGNLIAASQGALVVTVLAGEPSADLVAPDWDRAAGFTLGAQAVRARRKEDARAVRLLGAEPVWLDFLDSQYVESPQGARGGHPAEGRAAVDIAVRLARLLSLQQGAILVAPMGLFHSDHIVVNAACMLLREAASANLSALAAGYAELPPIPAPPKWLFYEDAIYRRLPGMVQSRLIGWWQEGLVAAPVHLPVCQHQSRKTQAVEAYESQLQLFNAQQLADIGAPERYWTLDAAGAAPP
jgi:LmbE family N-acetylglucosaminyl deacetylase